MPAPSLLATVRRGTALEATVRGHVVVAGASGELLSSSGDPGVVTTLRSCVKPLQALPFVARAAKPDGGEDEVAIACASHGGEPVHVGTVERLLERFGLSPAALECGPQLPSDSKATAALLAAGGTASPVTNNCSGKHAAMLAVCTVRGWPAAGYTAFDHPLQAEIRAGMSELGGIDLDTAPVGIDGCGLPTHGVELRVLARMVAAAATDPSFRRCGDAMAAHPYLVAGRERFDTALLSVAGDRLTAKGGAAGVWVAVRRPGGPGLAIKLEAGEESAMPAVALAALARLGWVEPADLEDERLARFVRPAVRNWRGTVVGAIAVEPGWLDAFEA